MFPRGQYIRATVFFLLGIFSCGCAETYLEGPDLGEGYVRLAATGRRPVEIRVNIPAQEMVIGRQWTLLIIPAGTVRVKDPQQLLSVAAFRSLARHGYRPAILNSAPEDGHPATLTLNRMDLSCSVPDLLFVRIVRCDLTIDGTFAAAPGLTVSGHGASWQFRLVGFRPQLEVELEHTLDAALDDLLERVALSDRI